MKPRTAAVFGLGNMGSALARAFLAGHRSVAVWKRTANKAAPLAKRGAKVAESVAAAVQRLRARFAECSLSPEV